MKLSFLLFIFPIIVFCQETKEQVAERLKPAKSKIVHSIIQQEIWGNKDAIIVFYETRYIDSTSTTQKYGRQYIEAYLYVKKNQDYEKVLITKFEDDNVDTNIESVFFANADKDDVKELIIISTVVHRLQDLYEGTEYSTSVFDDFKIGKNPKELEALYDMDNRLSGGLEGYMDGEDKRKSKIKTAKDVKKKLKKLGY
jgi:hypothetical protein